MTPVSEVSLRPNLDASGTNPGLALTQLDDPTLYTRDRKAFDAASAAMAKAHADLTTAEEQWLELELLREELSQRG